MRTLLVTGGAGFIGSNLVDALVRRGDQVRVLDNLSHRPAGESGPPARQDRADRSRRGRSGRRWPGRWRRRLRLSPSGFGRPCRAASSSRSTPMPPASPARWSCSIRPHGRACGGWSMPARAAAYGDQPTSSKRETDLPLPISPYGAAKVGGRAIIAIPSPRWAGFETVTLRYFNVFGPRQDPHSEYSAVIPLFITLLLAGRAADDLWRRPAIARFHVRRQRGPGQSAGGRRAGRFGPRTQRGHRAKREPAANCIEVLNRLLGTSVEPQFAPPRAGDVRESLADITQARKLLGYEPQVGFDEGLRRSIDYYRSIVGG